MNAESDGVLLSALRVLLSGFIYWDAAGAGAGGGGIGVETGHVRGQQEKQVCSSATLKWLVVDGSRTSEASQKVRPPPRRRTAPEGSNLALGQVGGHGVGFSSNPHTGDVIDSVKREPSPHLLL